MEFVALAIPILAFFARGAYGFKQYRTGVQHPWQTAVFVMAILLLALADTVFILFESIPNIAQGSDYLFLGAMYLLYLVLVSIALFPLPGEGHELNHWT